jgi:hypothetical protein
VASSMYKLTEGLRNQIKNATGWTITELNIDLAATGRFSEKDLDNLAGARYIKTDHQ